MQSQSLRRKVRQSSSLKGVGWADLLKMFDGDGDGQVTLEEFSEVLPPCATHFLHRVYDVLVSQTPPRLLVPFRSLPVPNRHTSVRAFSRQRYGTPVRPCFLYGCRNILCELEQL